MIKQNEKVVGNVLNFLFSSLCQKRVRGLSIENIFQQQQKIKLVIYSLQVCVCNVVCEGVLCGVLSWGVFKFLLSYRFIETAVVLIHQLIN